MKNVSVALASHLAGTVTSVATCWLVTLDSGTVLGFTDHDEDIVIDGLRYESSPNYSATDIQSTAALSVDNLELSGMQGQPSITEEDVLAGLWDNAKVEIFQVNYEDLSQGRLLQRSGTLGEVTLERGAFKAELRGMMQAYTTAIVELCSPSCRAELGDNRCKVDMTSRTYTGIVEGVSTNGLTVYDSTRVEDGPTGSVDITGITNANPGVVSLFDASLILSDRQAVTLSGIVGPSSLNAVTVVRNPTATTFELGVDTSNTDDYPPYITGGTVTLLGFEAGVFDYGLFTFDTGANAGLSMEVKSYVPGQITFQLPFPKPIDVGDEYTIVEGCDKSHATCKLRFNNILNRRAEDFVPGIDKVIQIARRG